MVEPDDAVLLRQEGRADAALWVERVPVAAFVIQLLVAAHSKACAWSSLQHRRVSMAGMLYPTLLAMDTDGANIWQVCTVNGSHLDLLPAVRAGEAPAVVALGARRGVGLPQPHRFPAPTAGLRAAEGPQALHHGGAQARGLWLLAEDGGRQLRGRAGARRRRLRARVRLACTAESGGGRRARWGLAAVATEPSVWTPCIARRWSTTAARGPAAVRAGVVPVGVVPLLSVQLRLQRVCQGLVTGCVHCQSLRRRRSRLRGRCNRIVLLHWRLLRRRLRLWM